MRKYSVFAIAREAMRGHKGWEEQWASPDPRNEYDVVIVGAGLGGLSTALRLAASGRQVTVLEREGFPGGRAGVLHDGGYDDHACIAWLHLEADYPGRAIDALRENRGSEVKRRAQAIAL